MSSPVYLKYPVVKKGETILITGVNGLIASHIADQLLAGGYAVRGTVRSSTKNAWMAQYFATRHPQETSTLSEVPDISISGCFDDAVKGCAGVVHTTSSVELTATAPEPAIGTNVRTVLTAMEAAAKTKCEEIRPYVFLLDGVSSEPGCGVYGFGERLERSSCCRCVLRGSEQESRLLYFHGWQNEGREGLLGVYGEREPWVYIQRCIARHSIWRDFVSEGAGDSVNGWTGEDAA